MCPIDTNDVCVGVCGEVKGEVENGGVTSWGRMGLAQGLRECV